MFAVSSDQTGSMGAAFFQSASRASVIICLMNIYACLLILKRAPRWQGFQAHCIRMQSDLEKM